MLKGGVKFVNPGSLPNDGKVIDDRRGGGGRGGKRRRLSAYSQGWPSIDFVELAALLLYSLGKVLSRAEVLDVRSQQRGAIKLNLIICTNPAAPDF